MGPDNSIVRHGKAMELWERPKPTDTSTSITPAKGGGSAAVEDVGGDDLASVEDQSGTLMATKSTQDDILGMRRMGKDQQFVRNFRLFSITAFVAIATASWEIGLFIITPGLVDGGRAGLIWSVLWSFLGFAPIWLSMAEMASMAPIAGAQYHWVSEFAPESCQRFLSYIAG